jgi:hypothetical protein
MAVGDDEDKRARAGDGTHILGLAVFGPSDVNLVLGDVGQYTLGHLARQLSRPRARPTAGSGSEVASLSMRRPGDQGHEADRGQLVRVDMPMEKGVVDARVRYGCE